MTIPAWAISANSLTAETFRQGPSSLLAGAGVVGSGDYAVAQHSSGNMSVDVAAGQAWVPGTLASTAGFPTNGSAQTGYGLPSTFNEQASYYGWNSGTVNLTISASNPSNPRIDLVVLAVQDAEYSGSNNQMLLEVITGTPASSPSPPSPPSSSIVLAQIAVGAGVTQILTANITDERPLLQMAAGERGNPAGRVYANGVSMGTAAGPTYTAVVADWLYGGMTTSTHGLTIPVTGVYQVGAAMTSVNGGAATVVTWGITRNSGTNYTGGGLSGGQLSVASSAEYGMHAGGLMSLVAGDTIQPYGVSSAANSGASPNNDTSGYNFLSAVLVSR